MSRCCYYTGTHLLIILISVPPPRKGGELKMVTKVAGEPVKRMNLNVPVDLHNSFKIATVIQGKDMTEVLIDYIRQYVEKHYPKNLDRKKGRSK